MESQNFGHQHPLVLNQDESNQSEVAHCCSRCGEVMFGPSFNCVECEFWLHKDCAEAPEQINHSLHRDHPLCLLPTAPYKGKAFICSFCGERGEKFVYNCSSCDLDLHIKCALFTIKFAEKKLGDLKGIAYKDPSFSSKSNEEELERYKCLGCWEPLLDSAYYSLDHGFKLHKQCVELSLEIDYPLHRNHLLILQFSVQNQPPCIICHDIIKSYGSLSYCSTLCNCSNPIKRYGLSYCCSICNLSIHIACLSLSSIIEGNSNQHPFTLISRLMGFTCDACGVEGNSVPYMSSNRNLLLHKNCISLPPVIKYKWHEHLLFHSYFIRRDESSSKSKSKNWDCVYCLDEVNTNHGSYYCSECHFILHVNCATKHNIAYTVIESVKEFNKNRVLPEESYIVIERNEDEEATKIEHFTHQHNLILSDKILLLKDTEFCDGCTLPILDQTFYSCSSKCKFYLHKKCVEFPKRKYIWFDYCDDALSLISGRISKCDWCFRVCNGFLYACPKCYKNCCLRCAIHLTFRYECEGHEHPLSFLVTYKGSCTNCGKKINKAYICKICNVAFCVDCNRLPSKAQHRCDEHLLALMIILIQKLIFVISVKKVEIQVLGFIPVQLVTLLLIPIVFFEGGNIHLSN